MDAIHDFCEGIGSAEAPSGFDTETGETDPSFGANAVSRSDHRRTDDAVNEADCVSSS